MNAGASFTTSTATLAEAISPNSSQTSTRIQTVPVLAGACQRVSSPSTAPVKRPPPALHQHVRGSPSGSDASAVSRTSPPGPTRHGSQDAVTVGGSFVGVVSQIVTVTEPGLPACTDDGRLPSATVNVSKSVSSSSFVDIVPVPLIEPALISIPESEP